MLYARGEDPGVVMHEMGHTDPASRCGRGEGEKAALRALVEAFNWQILADEAKTRRRP